MNDHGWIKRLAGKFIVFDGPDGSGKSTQFRRLHALAEQNGVSVCEAREPGGTIIGEQIRQVLLDPAHDMMDLRCEMLLYMASRAQLVSERILPAKAKNQLVLADRFISSTLAYQGTAGGMRVDDILTVAQVAVGQCWPDLVIVFDVDEATAAKRLNPLLDRMEQKGAAYHARVRQGYLDQAKADPLRYVVVDARPEAEVVFGKMCEQLETRVNDQ
ncbi:MAG: dTMP kinase [Phycisphaerales bacterium]